MIAPFSIPSTFYLLLLYYYYTIYVRCCSFQFYNFVDLHICYDIYRLLYYYYWIFKIVILFANFVKTVSSNTAFFFSPILQIFYEGTTSVWHLTALCINSILLLLSDYVPTVSTIYLCAGFILPTTKQQHLLIHTANTPAHLLLEDIFIAFILY